MLARLLRAIYIFQFITGLLLGGWLALTMQTRWGQAAFALVPLVGVVWIVFWQAVIISFSMLNSRPAGAGLAWFKAVWGEFKSALLIFVIRQPWVKAMPMVMPPLTHPGANARPVLLVHGFVCNHRVWNKVAHALRRDGHTVLSIDLEPLFASIDVYAPMIQQAVDTLRSQTGADKVVLVGHSMGGLAIRAWMRAYGSDHLARIITLGTPHQGTRVVQWISTPNGRQMAWQSQWLRELNSCETPAQRQLMYLAFTHHDNVVHPQQEQTLDGVHVTEFTGIGHLQMCLDDEVIRWLVQQVHDAQ